MSPSTDTPPEPRTHHRGIAPARHEIADCRLDYCGLDQASINTHARGLEARDPETPVQRLRRIVDREFYRTDMRDYAKALVEAIESIRADVDQLRDEAAQREREANPMHRHGDPIPTPNRPDQTPTEQRPEMVLGEVPLVPACQLWTRGTEHNPHGDCPGHDGD